jgi:phosphatidylglycerophosphatase A
MVNPTALHPAPHGPTGKRTIWAWTIATFFGAGFWNPGPGTAGSLAAAAIWWLAFRLSITSHKVEAVMDPAQIPWITGIAALALLIVGIPAASVVARETGRKDPQRVVADEAVGQWIALIGAPTNAKYAFIGFILFRAFDIWKPPPVRQLEQLPAGWGIMLDDVGAGIYALICLQAIHHWLG